MKSFLMMAAARPLLRILLILSLYFLVRGHNDPGGGFIGGLMAASAFAVFALSRSVEEARKALRLEPIFLVGLGFLVLLSSGFFAFEFGEGGLEYMKGIWVGELRLPIFGTVKVGTPFLFDIGVFLVVMGTLTEVVFRILEFQTEKGELS
jgi:multicomponent Na+:H+ antiporter subunit B